MSHPRIVICTAAVGCGHTQAARAVADAISTLRPEAKVEVVEALDFAPRWFTATYRDGYLQAISRLPALAGRLYHMTDRPPGRPGVGDALEARALRRLLALESIQHADVILTTHFLCARVLSRAKASGRLSARLGVIVTDQHPHGLWLVPHADQLLVASPDAASTAINAGIDADRVHVVGIPIHPRFARTADPAAIRQHHRLPPDRPTLLLAGGGLGLGGIDRALASLMNARREFHVLAICGRNASLRASLDRFATAPAAGQPSCEVLGFTSDIHDLMQVASLYVGKPGGLSTAECCARGLPMVLMRPIPGQEDFNARRLVSAGAAVLEADPAAAGTHAAELVTNAPALHRMRDAATALGMPGAASTIASRTLTLLSSQRPMARSAAQMAGN